MRKSGLLILGASIAIVSPAAAADWVSVGEGNGNQIQIDRSSITGGDVRSLWIRFVVLDPKPRAVSQQLSWAQFNCPGRTYHVGSTTFYRTDGSVRQSADGPTAFEPVPPDTLVERAFNAVCHAS